MGSEMMVLGVILIAFSFDFINGFHDAANSIATLVATKVLSPRLAVIWAAFFNFIAFMIFNLTVAKTVGQGLVDLTLVDTALIFSALSAAILWSLLTWYFGIPSSSSHALIGGLAGAAIAKGGIVALKLLGFIKIFLGIALSMIFGCLFGFICLVLFNDILLPRISIKRREWTFKMLQLISSAFLSLTHGGNDAQKTMGIIAILLFSNSWLTGSFYIPFWVIISCQLVISLGTLVGGWRVVETMGFKITSLGPVEGCAAEMASAMIIFSATQNGIPLSTTSTVTSAIAGVGFTRGLKRLNWILLRLILLTWLLTLPAAAGLSYLLWKGLSLV